MPAALHIAWLSWFEDAGLVHVHVAPIRARSDGGGTPRSKQCCLHRARFHLCFAALDHTIQGIRARSAVEEMLEAFGQPRHTSTSVAEIFSIAFTGRFP